MLSAGIDGGIRGRVGVGNIDEIEDCCGFEKGGLKTRQRRRRAKRGKWRDRAKNRVV